MKNTEEARKQTQTTLLSNTPPKSELAKIMNTFFKDTQNFTFTIEHDSEKLKHIKAKQPNSSTLSYEIIATENHLTFIGDIGTFVWNRGLPFFNHDRIYLNYWAEKLQAEGKGSQASARYGEKSLITQTVKQLKNHLADNDHSKKEITSIVSEFKEDLSLAVHHYDPNMNTNWMEVLRDSPHYDAFYEDYTDYKEPTYAYQWANVAVAYTANLYYYQTKP